jgi:hypothetical protein
VSVAPENIVDGEYSDSPGLRAIRVALELPFDSYARQFLKIRTKESGIQPFEMNVGQRYIHEMAEKQMDVRGHVRIAMLKARQWGGSTYIEGRFYRKITQGHRGQKAMIVTHRKDATGNLFRMAKRYHDYMDPRLKPFSGRSSITALTFPKRDSSYTVATAGAKNIGHSDTIQLLHASEFALWPNAADHLKGVFQTVPTGGQGSEVWIESTGDGMANEFYTQIDLARKGLSEYEFAFVPWYWFNDATQPISYVAEPRKDLLDQLSEKDFKYMQLYGLNEAQMAFRQLKIIEFGGGQRGLDLFDTQYPTCPEDAFQTTGEGSYIEPLLVRRARTARVLNPHGPKIMGIDPSWLGKDRFSVHLRQGRRATIVGEWKGLRTTQSVGKCVWLIKKHRPEVVFVDAIGIGAGVVDQLIELEQSLNCRVIAVNAGSEPDDDRLYGSKRDEMWGRVLEWLQMDQPVQIDDRDDLQRDLTVLQLEYDRANRPRPESKQKLKARKLPSPDHADSLCLTFAYDVVPEALGRAGSDLEPDRPISV